MAGVGGLVLGLGLAMTRLAYIALDALAVILITTKDAVVELIVTVSMTSQEALLTFRAIATWVHHNQAIIQGTGMIIGLGLMIGAARW